MDPQHPAAAPPGTPRPRPQVPPSGGHGQPSGRESSAGPGTGRPLRADARRNRARILQVAFGAFAAEGLSVPVAEIARRAGVGTGTVSRHFPTKESLFEAILLDRAEHLAAEAGRLAAADPGEAFFEFFSLVIAEGAANLGMAQALAGAGFDLDATARRTGLDIMGALGELLARAQRAGAVRSDADISDVKALITGCLARTPDAADRAARDRMISIIRQGLRNALRASETARLGKP